MATPLKITPASLEEMILVAKYYRQCARDEHEGITAQKKITMGYGSLLANTYMAKALALESLIEKDITLKTERLKEVHKVSTEGKTLDLFNQPPVEKKEPIVTPPPVSKTEPAKQDVKETPTDDESKEKKEMTLDKKKSNPKETVYTSLSDVPLKEEDKEYIIDTWRNKKGNKAKRTLYEKVRDLMNYYDLGVAELRSEIGSFVHEHKASVERENNAILLKDILDAGHETDLSVIMLDDLPSGAELLKDSVNYAVNDEFNLLLLTGYDDFETVPPADYVKIRAVFLRMTNRESLAIKELKDFFTTKTLKWDDHMAFLYLNELTKNIGHKPVMQLVKNILKHKKDKENNAISAVANVSKLLYAYSKTPHHTPVETDKDGNVTKFDTRYKHWSDAKIYNIIDRCVKELQDTGEEIHLTSKKTKGEAPRLDAKTNKQEPSDAKKEEPGSKAPAKKEGKANKASTPSKKSTPASPKQQKKTKVSAQQGVSNKKQTGVTKPEAKKPANDPGPKQPEVKPTTAAPESNAKTSKFIGVIFQDPKTNKFGCYVKGLEDVYVQNINKLKTVPKAFEHAIKAYKEKVNRQNAKGKLYKMVPKDLTLENIDFHNIGVKEVNVRKLGS